MLYLFALVVILFFSRRGLALVIAEDEDDAGEQVVILFFSRRGLALWERIMMRIRGECRNPLLFEAGFGSAQLMDSD